MSHNELRPGLLAPMVGDEVLVRGTVDKFIPGVGVQVVLLSKSEDYTAWVRSDLVEAVLPWDTDQPEPADGVWVLGDGDGEQRVFHRDDAEGHCDDGRRHDRRWWDVVGQVWVDWPTAVRRGADPARQLVVKP